MNYLRAIFIFVVKVNSLVIFFCKPANICFPCFRANPYLEHQEKFHPSSLSPVQQSPLDLFQKTITDIVCEKLIFLI